MIISLFIGIFATIIGALPPGASNLAVVNTTAQENIQESLKISYGAALGEIMIATLALYFGMTVHSFYKENIWIQVVFVFLLAALGVFFFFKKQKKRSENKLKKTKFARGLLFGLINPPVLVYWIALFSMLSSYYHIHNSSPWSVLGLFFVGVFLGKVLTLYSYALLSDYIIKRNDLLKKKLNYIMGIVLIVIACAQGLKLAIV